MRALTQKNHMTDDIQPRVIASFPPGGGAQFGIVLATRADAMGFADSFRAQPYRYVSMGKAEEVVLRLGPPRTDEMKSK